jgi:hypothetical protein
MTKRPDPAFHTLTTGAAYSQEAAIDKIGPPALQEVTMVVNLPKRTSGHFESCRPELGVLAIPFLRCRGRSRQHEARAAFPQRRSSNANSLSGQNPAGSPQICAIFQRDNLQRHF